MLTENKHTNTLKRVTTHDYHRSTNYETFTHSHFRTKSSNIQRHSDRHQELKKAWGFYDGRSV